MDEISSEVNDAYEERDPRMPSLGSRVIRGRDWEYPNQDNFGTGTVIGHSKDGKYRYTEFIHFLNSLESIFVKFVKYTCKLWLKANK